MNGFILILSVVHIIGTGGPTGGAAANYTTATFAALKASNTAAQKTRELVYNDLAGHDHKPHVSAV